MVWQCPAGVAHCGQRCITQTLPKSQARDAYIDVAITDLTANDEWQVFVSATSPPQNINSKFQDCTRHSGYFRITNNMGVASAFDYVVVRTG